MKYKIQKQTQTTHLVKNACLGLSEAVQYGCTTVLYKVKLAMSHQVHFRYLNLQMQNKPACLQYASPEVLSHLSQYSLRAGRSRIHVATTILG